MSTFQDSEIPRSDDTSSNASRSTTASEGESEAELSNVKISIKGRHGSVLTATPKRKSTAELDDEFEHFFKSPGREPHISDTAEHLLVPVIGVDHTGVDAPEIPSVNGMDAFGNYAQNVLRAQRARAQAVSLLCEKVTSSVDSGNNKRRDMRSSVDWEEEVVCENFAKIQAGLSMLIFDTHPVSGLSGDLKFDMEMTHALG